MESKKRVSSGKEEEIYKGKGWVEKSEHSLVHPNRPSLTLRLLFLPTSSSKLRTLLYSTSTIVLSFSSSLFTPSNSISIAVNDPPSSSNSAFDDCSARIDVEANFNGDNRPKRPRRTQLDLQPHVLLP
ncbi:hypothetical protein FA13DRAFT_1801183 [Coprinellus micaceus]|uniref:Uncharacterized protein n=1 Tax=Coprinellus micaceus TaxID=71717 RepID=A0A4Y7SFG2_COPMI|nr:hypothetical protein FA13DRAFT_1801183 [Coprinellus micaceus]